MGTLSSHRHSLAPGVIRRLYSRAAVRSDATHTRRQERAGAQPLRSVAHSLISVQAAKAAAPALKARR